MNITFLLLTIIFRFIFPLNIQIFDSLVTDTVVNKETRLQLRHV